MACSIRPTRSRAWSSCSCSTIRSLLRSLSLRPNWVSASRSCDDVVGEEAGSGIPHDRGDGLRLARDLGLVPERLELAADLAREIRESGQVRLHRLELAERLLLAPTVLQDAGGLLDEAATLLGAGVQHGVELALSDDDVHLAPEAGVAQQFLHIEQPARFAVDRVLAAAVAEQRARDRDLGVVDRQRAIRVVDGEQHFGTAERTPGCRAREDDVFHLAAAQGLRHPAPP